MRSERGQFGMSLMEVLVALAVILILISTLIGVGSYVKTRANLDLTQASFETLSTALEKYYSDQTPNAFPFVTEKDYDGDTVIDPYDQPHLEYDLQGAISSGAFPVHTSVVPVDPTPVSSASSAALFYFLDKNPSSRAIVEAVSNSLITNKDDSGADIQFTFTAGNTIDLPRYIDPWKMSIRYEYLTGTAFPVLTSAGPDRVFDTPDDITSK